MMYTIIPAIRSEKMNYLGYPRTIPNITLIAKDRPRTIPNITRIAKDRPRLILGRELFSQNNRPPDP